MAAIRVRVNRISPGLKTAALRAATPAIRRKVEVEGPRLVADANAAMARRFNLNRPFERRRSPGSRRASTALDYFVEGNELPIRLGFRVLGGDDVVRRIIILNFGSQAHEIGPSGQWPLRGASGITRLSRGSNIRARTGDVARALAWIDELDDVVVRGSVWHPGQRQPGGFLEEAVAKSKARLR